MSSGFALLDGDIGVDDCFGFAPKNAKTPPPVILSHTSCGISSFTFIACYPCLSGSVSVRELVKWGGYGLMRFNGQVDGGMSWRGALPQSLRTCARSDPSTLLSKLMSEAAL